MSNLKNKIKLKLKKKEYIWISSNEVDETGAYYTEWNKPERKTKQNKTKNHQYSILMHTYGIKLFLSAGDIYVEYPMKSTATE